MASEERKQMMQQVEELAETIAHETGVELVDVEFKGSRQKPHIVVYIDKEGGVTLDDCEQVNKLLGELLDIKDPVPSSYVLEVSSPGIERPIKKKCDFLRFQGSYVKIKTYEKIEGQKNFKGLLTGLRDDHVVLQDEGGREIQISLDRIAKAHLWDKQQNGGI